MMKWQAFLLSLILMSGCSRVLSKRTDEQAWLEFDQESLMAGRSPAATTESPLKEALAKIQVRSILLKCGQQVSASVCYQSALILQFDETYRKVQKDHPEVKTEDYRKEQKDFLALRSFEKVSEEVNRFHQSILSGIEFKARERADELFSQCESNPKKDASIDRFDLFSGGPTAMPKGVYACLVSKWLSSEERLLQETSDRLGLTIVSEEAKQWIKDRQVASIFEQAISESAEKKAKAEHDRFEKEKKEIFKSFDPKQSDEMAVQEWAPKLREKFAYSPVEQWILDYRKEVKN